MAINKKLIHFKSKQKFNEELANGNILDTSIVFILDTSEIYTHGLLYDGSTFDPSDIEASIENIINNKADKSEVPTKTSDLTNDSGFITINDVPTLKTYTFLENSNYLTITQEEFEKIQNADIVYFYDEPNNIQLTVKENTNGDISFLGYYLTSYPDNVKIYSITISQTLNVIMTLDSISLSDYISDYISGDAQASYVAAACEEIVDGASIEIVENQEELSNITKPTGLLLVDSYGDVVSLIGPYAHITTDGVNLFKFIGDYNNLTIECVLDLASMLHYGTLHIKPKSEVDLSDYYNKSEIDTKVNNKQDILVSGTNIKTINGESILGEGDISSGFIKGEGESSAILNGSKNCSATGDYSIAGGEYANATGEASVALGRGCEASGRGAIALGGVLEAIYVTGKAGSTTYTANSYINEYFVGSDISSPYDYSNKIATILSVSGNLFTVDRTLSEDTDLENDVFCIIGCNAQGVSSIALGSSFKSIGTNSSSEGRLTVAAGDYSHVEGLRSLAAGDYSHSEGIQTTAKGVASHCEGAGNRAEGKYSHAEGNGPLNIYFTGNNKIYTVETGNNIQNSFSFVKGIVGKSILNSENIIIATVLFSEIADDGYTVFVTLDADLGELKKARYTILFGGAYGDCSHSENISMANGKASHSQGDGSIANGDGSFTHGSHSVADGGTSAVFGTNNYAQNNSEFSLGISNHSHTGETPAEQTLFSVGCGDWQTMGMDVRIANQIPLPTPEDGTNALEVMRNGDVWLGNYSEGTKIYNGENKEANFYVKSEVDTKINNKQDKASRNLIINSNFDNGGIISNNLPWAHKALGGGGTIESVHTGHYNDYNAAQLQYVIYGQPVTLEAGKIYTLSCMYISDGSTNSYLDYNNLLGEKNIINGSNILIDSSGIRLNSCYTYTKAYVTFSVSQTSERVLAIGNTDTSGRGGLFISCIQLEEGNVATEYKRAEETYVTTSMLKDAVNSLPDAVTESTVSDWGFTKNVGTITGVSANGTTIATSGVANIPAASTSAYGVTKLSSSTSSTSTSLAATASAVKSAYDLANGRQEKLVSGTNIKTINGQSLLGSGNIVISSDSSSGSVSGGSSSGAYQLVNHGTSDTTFTLTPNTFHVWAEVSTLTLTLGTQTNGVANEYLFQFTSGSEPTTLILPDSIQFNSDFTIEANKKYQISILNKLGTVMSWEYVPQSGGVIPF